MNQIHFKAIHQMSALSLANRAPAESHIHEERQQQQQQPHLDADLAEEASE